MTLRFRIVNVFTRGTQRLSGNPLCVFESASALDTATMQALARQFNLSETTFILPSACANAQIRIFTPGYEMTFAGHPTLGTAHVCRALRLGGDSLTLELPVGVVPVEAVGNRWTLTAPAASWRELTAPIPQLARALGLDERDIGQRPLWVKAGSEQLIVPLTSVAAVHRAMPQAGGFADIRNEAGFSMAYVFAYDSLDRASARFFFPQGTAILEDPATGSATANFGAWCIATQRPLPLHCSISQGDMIDRPSSLYLDIDAQRRVFVGGDVIEVGQGTVTLG